MTAKKENKLVAGICGYGWLISWLAAIWVTNYGKQLFLTGAFLLFITLVAVSPSKKKEKNEQ